MGRIYPVKKGINPTNEYLLETVKEVTGTGEIKGDHVICSIPGIKVIDIAREGKNISVTTENDSDNKDPLGTVRAFNNLMEKITGYSSKERKKKFSKI